MDSITKVFTSRDTGIYSVVNSVYMLGFDDINNNLYCCERTFMKNKKSLNTIIFKNVWEKYVDEIPNKFNDAGGFSVFHIPSITATFIF